MGAGDCDRRGDLGLRFPVSAYDRLGEGDRDIVVDIVETDTEDMEADRLLFDVSVISGVSL